MPYRLETTNEILNGDYDQRDWTLHSEHPSLEALNATAKETVTFGTYIRAFDPDGNEYAEYDNLSGFQMDNPHDDA